MASPSTSLSMSQTASITYRESPCTKYHITFVNFPLTSMAFINAVYALITPCCVVNEILVLEMACGARASRVNRLVPSETAVASDRETV